ncbi:hypothetical protein AYO41_01600 [Verrucomicrobia bacterium SCGC AG-212-E04]|nr:hypothetical protein AYO41_01600 [Verrucomicrobia bacterium SCGC AG-212-E04]
MIAIPVMGFALADYVDGTGLGSQHHISSNNIYYFLVVHFDRWMWAFSALLGAVALIFLRRGGGAAVDVWPVQPDRRIIPGVAILAGVVAAIGTHTVCLNHPLSMDEFLSNFQARIFLSGRIFAPLGPIWNDFGDQMTPALATYDPIRATWTSTYLPVYAAMRAPFLALGADTLLNPLLVLVSVGLIAAVARRIWPTDPWAPAIAAIFLAVSPQFLITGMTPYSMPAHLCLNLLWLSLYLRDDRLGLALAPWVGVAALGLHQPNIHAIFVAPFLLRMVWERRWGRVAYFAPVYMLGCLLWLYWMQIRAPIPAVGESVAVRSHFDFILGLFSAPQQLTWINTGVLVAQVFSWQTWVVGFCALVSLGRFRSFPKTLVDLLAGILLSLAFYFFASVGHGHGWGNRFMLPFLGGFILLAVAGWKSLAGLPQRRVLQVVSLAITLAVEFPYRCFEVFRVTEPFAAADRYLRACKEPFVVVDSLPIWYGQDLVRNDPLLESTPKFFTKYGLKKSQVYALEKMGKVRLVTAGELSGLGLALRRRESPP